MDDYKFVEIDGKKYPIRFGMNALRKFGKRTNTNLSDLEKLGSDMNLETALQLIFAGIEDGYRKAKQKCELNIESLGDLIDNDFDAIAKCMNVLTQQMGSKKKDRKGKKQDPK